MIINMNGAKAPETPSSVLQEKTVTPETLPTVIGPDEGYDGLSQVTVNPDAQLKAENIRSGKTIFGVTGAFTGETVVESRNAGLAKALCGKPTEYDATIKVIKAEDWGTDIEAITGYFECNAMIDVELPHMNQFKDPSKAVIWSILTKGGYSATYTLRMGEDDVYTVKKYLISTRADNFFDIHIEDVEKHFISGIDASQFPQVPFMVDPNTNIVVISSKYTSLGIFTCWNMSNEFTVVIPESITSIGNYFCRRDLPKVTVKLLGSTPPTISSSTFASGYRPKKIIVPAGSLETYQTATNWSNYADIMEEATQ